MKESKLKELLEKKLEYELKVQIDLILNNFETNLYKDNEIMKQEIILLRKGNNYVISKEKLKELEKELKRLKE